MHAESLPSIGLLIRRLLPVVACVLVTVAVETGSSSELSTEKTILGFEEKELSRSDEVSREEKPGRESWFYLLEQPEGFDFAARFEWPGAINRAWTWRCRRGPHSEGEMALVAKVGPPNPQALKPTYQQTAFLSHYYPNLRNNFEAYRLMTSFQWLAKADPVLRDWSRYDLMRVDVRCDTARVELRLALEDDILEPPVMRVYRIPDGRWVTIELDLNEAVEARGLNLARVANFWLLGQASERAEVRIDNIRIAKRSVPVQHELIRSETPAKFPVDQRKRPRAPNLPSELRPDRSLVQLGEPVVVARGSIVPFGWVSAYDNRYLFVAYSFSAGTGKPVAKTAYSNDGGETWKPLSAPAARNLDHGTARGCAVGATGDGVAVSSGPGCAGLGCANPRQHLTKYTFTGTGWKVESPTILDADIRHCGSNASVVRLSSGPYRGRLWASWGQIGRAHRIDVHVKFSDDDGRTWIPWGTGAALPGSEAGPWSNGTYSYPQTVITPYKDYVACFWHHSRDGGVLWSVYDGSRWSPPSEVSSITLDRMDGAYRATMSAVTKGETEIFFTASGMGTVVRWDGDCWTADPIECEDGGMLSLAGNVVTLFTAGEVNRRWKGIDWSRRAVLRCYQRSGSGRWEGHLDLIAADHERFDFLTAYLDSRVALDVLELQPKFEVSQFATTPNQPIARGLCSSTPDCAVLDLPHPWPSFPAGQVFAVEQAGKASLR